MNIAISNQNYTIGRLNALTQFHVVRRLAPLLAVVGLNIDTIERLKNGEGAADFLGPATEALAQMKDEDANYVIFSCLAVVGRQQPDGRFSPVCTGDRLMFDDVDMVIMVRLVVEVVKENLSGFFGELIAGKSSPS